MKKMVFIIVWLSVAITFANPMCASFCMECKEKKEDATCAKIDSTCSCVAVLDSIRLEEERKAAEQERLRLEAERKLILKKTQIQKITDVLVDSCQNSFCAFEIFVEADTLKKMAKTKLPMAKDSLERYLKQNIEANPIGDSVSYPQEEQVLPPMNEQCKEFCAMCPADSISKIKDTSQVAMCTKIEEQCQCVLQAELAKKAEEKLAAEKKAAMEQKLLYLENAKKTAEKIYGHCNEVSKCSTLVTLRKKNLDVVEFRNIPVKKVETPVPVVKPVPKQESKPNNLVPKNPQKPKNLKENKNEKEKTFYSGISLNIGSLDRESYFEDFDEDEDGLIGGIGYLARWYFYSAGSFQLGINALVESVTLAEAEYSYLDFNVDQISLVAEIPIELRFGIPLDEYFAPFVSFSLNVRKYIYGWFEYEMENSWLYNDATEDGFYEGSDIDLLFFFGIGIEISKHFAIQYQWLIEGTGWRSGYGFDYDEEYTNRFSMDFAF
jgi:hypothetical protein